MTILAETMFMQIGATRYQVASFEQASKMFCAAREASGLGASGIDCPVLLNERGAVVGHISYNGRVWPGESWSPNTKPLYDNAGKSHV